MTKTRDRRTIDDVLQGAADVLFPGVMPTPRITPVTADASGDTPLHVYLWRRDAYAVRTLLAHGADVNAAGDMGETALHVAARQCPADIIAAVLAAGAREDRVSEFGQTPSQLARELDRAPVYQEARRLARESKPFGQRS